MSGKISVGVIGIGEVGSAISKILGENFAVFKKDLDFDEITNNKISTLHLCIPYDENFIPQAIGAIRDSNPDLVIIHSTIAVGVTRKIFKKTKIPIVHSPVMGVHKTLVADLKRFTKFIGPVDRNSAKLAEEHLKAMGIKTHTLNNSEESELGKLLDTTYYGWNILFCKLVGLLCEELKLDYENVYKKFNQVYNDGYRKKLPNVMRPVLEFRHPRDSSGGIGGHCVIENAEILNELFHQPFTQFILKEDARIKKIKK